jgi:hypothetical protein
VKVSYRYDPWNRLTAAGKEQEILSTGSVELEIKAAAKAEKETDMAWGKTVNDLQAGVATSAEKTTYQLGDTIEFVVKVRNVGKEPRDLSFASELFKDLAPEVTDVAGHRLTVDMPLAVFFRRLLEKKTLKPDEEFVLGTPKLVLLPATGKEIATEPALAAIPGKVKISYHGLARTPADGKEEGILATGSVDLEIKAADSSKKERNDRDKPTRPLLKEYTGHEQIPDALYDTYAKLIDAMATGEDANIQKYCLPKSINVSSKTRRAGTREYSEEQNEMNVPFLKNGFQKNIQGVIKQSDGGYLIRTNSSMFYFTETKNAGWKLYRYYDKPIE